MNLSASRFFYRLGIINHRVEFLVILSWMLFFPTKTTFFYFLSSAALVCFFLIRNVYFMKTAGFSSFNLSLFVLALLAIGSLFFSINYLKSLFLVADLILILCYFILFYNDHRKESELFIVIGYIVSVFSALKVIAFVFPTLFNSQGMRVVFFANSIHEGIISGLGVLIFFYYVLENKNNPFQKTKLVLLLVNGLGVFVSQSKAAYLGVVLFTGLLLFLKKKKWLPFLVLFVALTAVFPNPIRTMVIHSVKVDPYSLNRLDIWQMCGRIFLDYPLTGVGMDNFSEVAAKYNFKQPYGPAHYFKVSTNSHNDYLQLVAEMGLVGIVILMAVGYFVIKRIFSSSLFNMAKILLLYLLFQALFFNILFMTFFFFLFVFLLKNLLEGEVVFKSFAGSYKFALVSFLVVVFLAAYFLPWWSDGLMRQAQQKNNGMAAFALLNKAGYLNPLAAQVCFGKARILYDYFAKSTNLEAFYGAKAELKKAQALRPYFLDAYLLEADLYLVLLQKQIKYDGMIKDVMAVYEEAEKIAPVNPFLKMNKAKVYRALGYDEEAAREAYRALDLEPEYVEALYFLHRNYHYLPGESAFTEKIKLIQEKAVKWDAKPGQYLYELFKLP